MKRILIIGGGVAGLFSAYFLRKKGHEVVIADKGDFTNNCSFGNAGLIVPSHIVPLASPGMVLTGLKWALSSKAPLAFKIPPSRDLMKWGVRFLGAANQKHVQSAIPVLKELSLFSQSLYRQIVKDENLEFQMEEKGLLMLYHTAHTEKEEIDAAKLAQQAGLEAQILSKEEVMKMEPLLSQNVRGAVYYPGDSHLNPTVLMTALLDFLQKNKASFIKNTTIDAIEKKTNKEIYVRMNGNLETFDELIVAAGSGSNEVLKHFKMKIALQPGRGYSFLVKADQPINYPALLIDSRVSVTPFSNGQIRFGGGMELGYFNEKIAIKRFQEICSAIPRYYPEIGNIEPDKNSIWQGHRPCSFDGLPYIGKLPDHDNVTLATGHSMMGITLAPATGKLVAQIVDSEAKSVNIHPFRVDR